MQVLFERQQGLLLTPHVNKLNPQYSGALPKHTHQLKSLFKGKKKSKTTVNTTPGEKMLRLLDTEQRTGSDTLEVIRGKTSFRSF